MDSTSISNLISTLNETSGWEIAYVISNCVIAVFAVIALFQFRFYKNESFLKFKREEAILSTSLAQYFTKFIIPNYVKIGNEIGEPFFIRELRMVNSIKDFNSEEKRISEYFLKNDKEWNSLLDFFNELDSFSLPINNGITNSEMLFGLVGNNYCKMIEALSPPLVRMSDYEGDYENMLKLYKTWSEKLKSK